MSSTVRVLALALTACLSACSTSRYYDHRFSPAPLEAQIQPQADPAAQVRALVSVRGIARAREGRPDTIEIRLRLENLGTKAARLLPESVSLVSADLEPFGPAEIMPAGSHELAPGSGETLDLAFALPKDKRPSDFNLRGLNLRWTLSFQGQDVTTGASFQLDEFGVYDDPRVHFGFGVGYTHIN